MQYRSKTHPELVCRLLALSFVSECVELSGRSQTVTVSERPERDLSNAEDPRLLTTRLRIFTAALASMCQAYGSLWASCTVAAQFCHSKKFLSRFVRFLNTQKGSNSRRQPTNQLLGIILIPTGTDRRADYLAQPP